jgi:ParB-like chromosome segregation protein Spo0J
MKVAISKIKSNPDNPRIIKDDKFKQLVKSIKDFPQMLELRPIVVDSDMVVLGGNMRLKACLEAGLKEVDILIADQLSEDQKKEFIIKDNVGFGEWDWDILANEWDNELLSEWGLEVDKFDINNNIENELKDLSSNIDNLYRIEIICKDEEHQENTYNKLLEQGYECRLLTL